MIRRPLWPVFLCSSAHSGTLRAPLSGVFLCCLVHQAHRGALLAGVLLCRLARQAVKGAPCVGSYSVVQSVRRLMGQPLYCSAAKAGMSGREAMVMAPTPSCDSAISPCFHGCLAFLHRHFPPQPPPSHSLDLSLCSQQQPLPWDCSIIPKLQLPATAPSRGSISLSGVRMTVARTVWFSFHLGCRRSALSLSSLKCFSSDSYNCPDVGMGPLLQFPHLLRAGPVLLTLLFLPPPPVPLSCWVLHASIYSFPQALSTLGWCSACTSGEVQPPCFQYSCLGNPMDSGA